MAESNALLRMENIRKEFPGVTALDNVDFTLNKGEVHALLGENGAGKSTLMKILIGLYTPTSGKIWYNGEYIENKSVNEALDRNISMIHQELNPIQERSVMENIWLGREPKNRLGLIDHKKMFSMTKELLDRIHLKVNPKELVKRLTVAKIQMIEIAKAVSYDAKLIVMDEPTSSLTEGEVVELFELIRVLKAQEVGIIYISHKLDEIFEICDRVTIFRDGQFVADKKIEELDTQQMINLMVGRELNELFPKVETQIGETRLVVKNISDGENFRNISFDAHEGEIIGFAGLVGAGRTEVMEALFGISNIVEGSVRVKGKQLSLKDSSVAIENGLAFLTEDRRKTGIFPMLSVGYNIVSSSIEQYENKLGLLNPAKIRDDSQAYIDSFKIKTPSQETAIANLSGGNQQKALIAKWLLTNPDILILDEPTRGIDVGAKAEIYRTISKMAYTGKTILMVSSEMPEIIGMSDRIVVMHEGRITGILENKNLTQELVLEYATGVRDDYKNKAQSGKES